MADKKAYTFSKRSDSYMEKLAASRQERKFHSEKTMEGILSVLGRGGRGGKGGGGGEKLVSGGGHGLVDRGLSKEYEYVVVDYKPDSFSVWDVCRDFLLFTLANMIMTTLLTLCLPDINVLIFHVV